MIDAIAVSPDVHMIVGMLVLITSVVALFVTGKAAWKKRELTRSAHLILILFQLTLMVQVLVGIKLLDQGSGPLQLYIHYIGRLAPLAFFMLFYWWTVRNEAVQSRRSAVVSALSFLFVLMTFAIGGTYVPGGA